MSMIVFPVILHVKLWYQTVAFVAHILSHVICQICWFLAQTKPSPNLPSEPNISGCSTFFSMLVHNSCRVCHCIPRCNLCVMAAQCVYRRESAGWSRMISFGAQLVESTSALLKFLPVKWVLICRDSLQACINVSTEGTEKKYKTLNSTGWMRINCRCLDGLNPLSRVRDLAAIESEKWKKNPLGVFVSLTVDAAVVCLWLSICHGLWCWGIGPSSLLTLPHPFITHASIYLSPPSIHPPIPFLHVSPTGFEMFVSSLSLSTPPPPLWSPQKRLIQEGWAGVSELLLLCPMRCFHSTFLLLCCFYGPDMLTVQVAQSDVIQLYQAHKGCLFRSLRGRVGYLELCCHSRQFFLKWRNKQRKSVWQITGTGRSFYITFCFAESAHTLFMFLT